MDDLIVKTIIRIVTPFIYLYGAYIIVNASASPGGSFAGGAILGSAIVLYTIVFGLAKAEKKVPDRIGKLKREVLLCFVLMAFVVVFMGYDVLQLREAGAYEISYGESVKVDMLSLVNFGIAFKVTVTLVSLFHVFIKEDY